MSIHHMMATDYYRKSSYGYYTFVTSRAGKMSLKFAVTNNVYSSFWIQPAQIYGRRIMVIVHFGFDRILKMTKDGKSNNRELTNARAELDHWRANTKPGTSWTYGA